MTRASEMFSLNWMNPLGWSWGYCKKAEPCHHKESLLTHADRGLSDDKTCILYFCDVSLIRLATKAVHFRESEINLKLL